MSAARGETDRGVRVVQLTVFSVLMILIGALLSVVYANPMVRLAPFDSPIVNQTLNYQLSALPVAGLALLVTFVFARKIRLSYFTLKRTGPMKPLFGRSGSGRWETDAWIIGLLMAATIGLTSFFQFLPTGFSFQWAYVALVIPFAAMNAFTEEVIFRLSYVTMGANSTSSRAYGLAMGSIVFGVSHYWGVTPNGIVGALMSIFLGFVLAKSIQETKGFFWAFVIHFMLNIATMAFVLNQVT
ncbi:CPBP family intramembrane glutamic endopeptidase [Marisediminicola sp. LYQ134]|uniref:CPBP family intramembrane glutamic endopeptidase n=1 Tax=Marisediminicola sp. LYQ134 TaxID=3391061 RepID=UPI0039838466